LNRHEAREVGAEQRREDRVGLGVDQCLHDRAGLDLAERHCLLDELDAPAGACDHLALERRGGGLPVLVVRVDDRPALLAELCRLRDQHGRLHVGRGPQPERVLVAVLPHDLVGERFGGEKQHLALLGEVSDGEAHVRRERAHQQRDALTHQELLGGAHGVAGIAVVVADHELQLAAEHAAAGVDFVDRELHALPVRLEEGREHLVAVELAQLDRLGTRRHDQRERHEKGSEAKQVHRSGLAGISVRRVPTTRSGLCGLTCVVAGRARPPPTPGVTRDSRIDTMASTFCAGTSRRGSDR